ncbi:MAG: hypothetical protein A2249_03045 [Candidatus Jacksonbacteria bacterium RIFOXYA2_FULL_44_7]|uniref:Uncharacterized protein n=1 Tax=Candidatus Jacksonbacteria bacterium RIFCSPLOWO2_02_FULL_44_20 TaxID=1798460 RepID=A0A1G2A8Z5_9BACT|nr:MAG: hypothetical protein UW39_C0016G0017 [Parcubacteria group bacterium GW2011_GWC2_44_17]KKT50003.1 MAG: hypothetical protein UW40_C0012G0015 [Parcubacteria group bacterium GW2011_GWF2_44_17]OGY71091.1 MAG: hypothetical protein A3E05_00290 [Candidatus Jacksonbacteria bacterium RIFCSPHIGHO2_12_FULL_44_12]OGY71497.1 MAG: hypothetical protein A3C00_00760 [Candidatus Jacksonbacteria bacterium RIFCSPHIGHO2_02_FULL_44_25]OGY73281.1 MAG: hypothetical protein A3H61_00920 [Candidatus Jacksonbacteri
MLSGWEFFCLRRKEVKKYAMALDKLTTATGTEELLALALEAKRLTIRAREIRTLYQEVKDLYLREYGKFNPEQEKSVG